MSTKEQSRDGLASEANSRITQQLTKQFPLSIWNELADIPAILLLEHEVHLEPVVGPAPELHGAVLVVEGEPGDVDGTGGLEYAGRDVGTLPGARHYHVGLVGRVEALAGAETF